MAHPLPKVQLELHVYGLEAFHGFAYHSGVRIGRYEFCFGRIGLRRHEPQQWPGRGCFYHAIPMQPVLMPKKAVRAIIKRVAGEMGEYHVIYNNYIDFSAELLHQLGNLGVPNWWTVCLMP